ncbi:MAG: ribose 5-phosphate isomerase B [Candidatus Omnitrophota bacterium]|nr:ribose 5-phosphate isomerase B [Candidatus Omnitrophota bacterium]
MKSSNTVFVGADHRGFKLKAKIIKFLQDKKLLAIDVGAFNEEPCDYPLIAFKLAKNVAASKRNRGILVCKTGIGDSIAANKVKGMRAALCYNTKAARLSREHNDANVLVLGSDFVKEKDAQKIINIWLKTKFQGGRHLRRVNQIRKFEGRMKDITYGA